MRALSLLLFFSVLVPAILPFVDRGGNEEATTYRFHEDSEMTIYGSANITDWTMDVTEVEGEVAVEGLDENADTLRFENLRIRVPVEGITADRSGQERDAHEALRRDSYPVIYFTAHETELANVEVADGETFAVRAEGRLTVAGEAQEVEVVAEGERLDDDQFRFTGSKDLRMSDFGIDPPTAFLGVLRVRDDVTVEFDVVMVPES